MNTVPLVSENEVEICFGAEPSAGVLREIWGRTAAAHENALRYLDSGGEPQPFLVLTPLGIDRAAWLARELECLGVRVARRVRIHDWPRMATPLYLHRFDRRTLVRAAVYEESWKCVSGDQAVAERWDLHDVSDLACVAAAKEHLRSKCATLRMRARLPQATFSFGLHALHSPDVDQWATEFARLHAAVLSNR